MNTLPINPALLLRSLGGFSESHYLGLFRSVNRGEIAGVLRGLNATEIAFEGRSALALEAILAPLDAGVFPLVALELVADNSHAIDDLVDDLGESETSPLALAYCASLSLYANIASKGNEPCTAERAARALLFASKKLGALWGVEALKFHLWCFTLCSASSADRSRSICLAFAFLYHCDLLASLSAQLARQISSDSCAGLGSSLADQTVDDRFLRMLRQEFEANAGPDGKMSAAIQQAVAAVLGKD